MALSTPTRWILAGLISIGLQLCCCNAEVLLGGCCDSDTEATGGGCHGTPAGHDHSDGHDHGDHHTDSSDPVKNHDQPADPAGPCDHDGGGCACGTHDKAPSHIDKLELPTTVVAILPAPVVVIPVFVLGAARYAGLHGVSPPRTTLLHQHCALIV